MSFRAFTVLVAATALFVPVMLLADSARIGHQIALASATGLFLLLMVRKSSVTAGQVVCAMAIATAGELFLSLGWGLYSYRYAAIPFYVPIGHGIFYALATESSRQEPLRRRETLIVYLVLCGGSIYALATLVLAGDAWGLLWWAGAAVLMIRSRAPLLMATCVIYTILLEWAGTAIGNWRWAEVVPVVGLRSANPPSGVGILYCLLDLFTVMACSARLTVARPTWPAINVAVGTRAARPARLLLINVAPTLPVGRAAAAPPMCHPDPERRRGGGIRGGRAARGTHSE